MKVESEDALTIRHVAERLMTAHPGWTPVWCKAPYRRRTTSSGTRAYVPICQS